MIEMEKKEPFAQEFPLSQKSPHTHRVVQGATQEGTLSYLAAEALSRIDHNHQPPQNHHNINAPQNQQQSSPIALPNYAHNATFVSSSVLRHPPVFKMVASLVPNPAASASSTSSSNTTAMSPLSPLSGVPSPAAFYAKALASPAATCSSPSDTFSTTSGMGGKQQHAMMTGSSGVMTGSTGASSSISSSAGSGAHQMVQLQASHHTHGQQQIQPQQQQHGHAEPATQKIKIEDFDTDSFFGFEDWGIPLFDNPGGQISSISEVPSDIVSSTAFSGAPTTPPPFGTDFAGFQFHFPESSAQQQQLSLHGTAATSALSGTSTSAASFHHQGGSSGSGGSSASNSSSSMASAFNAMPNSTASSYHGSGLPVQFSGHSPALHGNASVYLGALPSSALQVNHDSFHGGRIGPYSTPVQPASPVPAQSDFRGVPSVTQASPGPDHNSQTPLQHPHYHNNQYFPKSIENRNPNHPNFNNNNLQNNNNNFQNNNNNNFQNNINNNYQNNNYQNNHNNNFQNNNNNFQNNNNNNFQNNNNNFQNNVNHTNNYQNNNFQNNNNYNNHNNNQNTHYHSNNSQNKQLFHPKPQSPPNPNSHYTTNTTNTNLPTEEHQHHHSNPSPPTTSPHPPTPKNTHTQKTHEKPAKKKDNNNNKNNKNNNKKEKTQKKEKKENIQQTSQHEFSLTQQGAPAQPIKAELEDQPASKPKGRPRKVAASPAPAKKASPAPPKKKKDDVGLNLEISRISGFQSLSVVTNNNSLQSGESKGELMEKFPSDKSLDLKKVIYNMLVDHHNGEPDSFVLPYREDSESGLKTGFELNKDKEPEKNLAELYALHIRKANLRDEDQNSVIIQDVYKFYFRNCVELLTKYFDKRGKYAFLDRSTPLFIPGGSLEEARDRIKKMKAKR